MEVRLDRPSHVARNDFSAAEAEAAPRVFSRSVDLERYPHGDPQVPTKSKALQRHGDVILSHGRLDEQRAKEARLYAEHFARNRDAASAKEARSRADAYDARGQFRIACAQDLFRQAKRSRTFIEKISPSAWRVFTGISLLSMTVSITGNIVNARLLDHIKHEATKAAVNSSSLRAREEHEAAEIE